MNPVIVTYGEEEQQAAQATLDELSYRRERSFKLWVILTLGISAWVVIGVGIGLGLGLSGWVN